MDHIPVFKGSQSGIQRAKGSLVIWIAYFLVSYLNRERIADILAVVQLPGKLEELGIWKSDNLNTVGIWIAN